MHISNRKQFAGRALKMIAFVLLTVLLLVGMSKTLVPRSNSASGGMHNYRARGFYGEEKDSLDVAAIGNAWHFRLFLWRTQSDHRSVREIASGSADMPEAKSCYSGDGRPFPGKHGRSSDLIGQGRSQLSFSGIGIS